MASASTMCTSCLRAATRSATRATKPTPVVRNAARAYTHAATPLYLDFLLPSAHLKTPKAPYVSQRRTQTVAISRYPRRNLATTPDPSAAAPARAILNPRTDDAGNPMTLSISPRASHRLHSIAQKDSAPDTALRVSIESGGCHGFQYLMSLTDLAKEPAGEEDTVFEGSRGEKVVVDESSLELLSGSTVDYTMELIGSQFKVTGIPGATSSCGCGTSFDIKMD
ncbi:[4Fe-4S] proteins maturation [Didymella sp. IMI 355093]|nr:[4Fe-4S] proteins maturation [Didymella sp. IMI 355093]